VCGGRLALCWCFAPRHPERFGEVYSVAIEFPALLATEMVGGKGKEGYSVMLREGQRTTVEIIVLDTIGDLAAVYGVADVAFVGGVWCGGEDTIHWKLRDLVFRW